MNTIEERAGELTKWHDPNVKKPICHKSVEIKYYCGGNINYANAYLRHDEMWATDYTNCIIDPYDVISWREINE